MVWDELAVVRSKAMKTILLVLLASWLTVLSGAALQPAFDPGMTRHVLFRSRPVLR